MASGMPLDEYSFRRRMSTFTILAWGSKPAALSPIQCAIRGWELDSQGKLTCQFCGCHLTIHLPKRSKELYERLVNEYGKKLVSTHKPQCVWLTVKCPDHFITGEGPSDRTLEEQIELAAKQLSVEAKLTPEFIEESNMASNIPESIHLYSKAKSEKAIHWWIASKGWNLRKLTVNQLLVCNICQRKLPLWFKENKTAEEWYGDLDKHLNWCPWILPLTEKTLHERMLTHITGSLSRKRKRKSEDYHASSSRKEEVKEIRKHMRAVTSLPIVHCPTTVSAD